MYSIDKIIILISHWIRYSSSCWVEYFYKYYNDIITDIYINLSTRIQY